MESYLNKIVNENSNFTGIEYIQGAFNNDYFQFKDGRINGKVSVYKNGIRNFYKGERKAHSSRSVGG